MIVVAGIESGADKSAPYDTTLFTNYIACAIA